MFGIHLLKSDVRKGEKTVSQKKSAKTQQKKNSNYYFWGNVNECDRDVTLLSGYSFPLESSPSPSSFKILFYLTDKRTWRTFAFAVLKNGSLDLATDVALRLDLNTEFLSL